jgi:hypothetical protein
MRRALVLAACLGVNGCLLFIHNDARIYPQWEVTSHEAVPLDCARVTAVAVKSGKTGVGVTVTFQGTDPPCTLHLTTALFEAYPRPTDLGPHPGMTYATTLPPPLRLSAGITVDAYLAFPFDNNTAYNDDARMGRLRLTTATSIVEIPFVEGPGNR